jgi:hypothetical protein
MEYYSHTDFTDDAQISDDKPATVLATLPNMNFTQNVQELNTEISSITYQSLFQSILSWQQSFVAIQERT